MEATVSGGAGGASARLSHEAGKAAIFQAQAIVSAIDGAHTSAVYYDPEASTPAHETAGKMPSAAGIDKVDALVPGNDTIVAGGGDNLITLTESAAAGPAAAETIHMGSGSETIDARLASGLFEGSHSVTGSGFTMTFVGAGHGGAGSDSIVASIGNETLLGGTAPHVFDLSAHASMNQDGKAATITIMDFSTHDLIAVGGHAPVDYALSTFHVVGGNGVFHLDDGTKVVLHGFTSLNASNFKS